VAEQVLPTLKPFQRATVEHAFDRLYSPTGSGRFLVADEVGLGKTMVAKGVIAKAIDRLESEGVKRIDVIYVCSNQVIARQNISKLNVMGDEHDPVPDRITMLPAHLGNLNRKRRGQKGSKVNVIPLTPTTSLDLRSNVGAARERVMLWYLLAEHFGERHMRRTGPRRVLQGGCRDLDSFDWYLDWSIEDPYNLNRGLVRTFLKALRHDARKRGDESLLARFEALGTEFTRKIKPQFRWEVTSLIGDMRRLPAESCIEALEADLVILDEFQRFRHLLDPDHEDSDLAQLLFRQESAKVLMLSATPYKMLTQGVDDPDEDHHKDFLATLRFLYDGPEGGGREVERCRAALTELRSGLRAVDTKIGRDRARAGKKALERSLRKVMARTERLVSGKDRNGMTRLVPTSGVELVPQDVVAFADLDRVAQAVGHHSITEYWKSTAYPLNFMEGYVLADEFEAKARGIPEARPRKGTLNTDRLRRYEAVDMGNPRLRTLKHDVIDSGMWKLLWLPASLPYYQPGRPFSKVEGEITKRLIFSAWNVVPRSVSCMLSYEAERNLVGLHKDKKRENTPEARASTSAALRPDSATAFALLYPSIALARLVDPLQIARERGAELTCAQVIRQARDRLEAELKPITAVHAGSGRDSRWYAAAALLLDQQGGWDPAEWLDSDHTRDALTARGERSQAWLDQLGRAIEVVERPELGLPPRNLLQMLALLSLGSPAVCAMRALMRIAPTADDDVLRDAALRVADGLRSTYNQPEIQPLIRRTNTTPHFWADALHYGVNGNLQAVLDEYVHVLKEWAPIDGEEADDDIVRGVGKTMADALSLRAPDYEIRDIDHRGIPKKRPVRMRNRFALRFGDAKSSEDEKVVMRAGAVRTAFNSPFWPFVLSTTSVGQEGLDFHLYSHAVVHWNLPSNPVDFEQREGRVHRYKCHAVRRNIGEEFRDQILASESQEPWREAFDLAAENGDDSGLVPFWVYDRGPHRILRYIPTLPSSRDIDRQARLERMIAAYRLTFGQPRQDELLKVLAAKDLDAEDIEELLVNLKPRSPS
jgi:hypothetical protein